MRDPLSILVGSGQANPNDRQIQMTGRDHLCTALAFGGEKENDDKGGPVKTTATRPSAKGIEFNKKKGEGKDILLLASFMLVMHNTVRVERMHRVRASGRVKGDEVRR